MLEEGTAAREGGLADAALFGWCSRVRGGAVRSSCRLAHLVRALWTCPSVLSTNAIAHDALRSIAGWLCSPAWATALTACDLAATHTIHVFVASVLVIFKALQRSESALRRRAAHCCLQEAHSTFASRVVRPRSELHRSAARGLRHSASPQRLRTATRRNARRRHTHRDGGKAPHAGGPARRQARL